MTRRRVACVAFLVALLVTGLASAQNDAAVRACLLLRSPAECGLVNAEPFYAPGDSQTLRVLRPNLGLLDERQHAAGERDSFTPLRGDAGGETVYERTRQLFTVPLRWRPFRAFSLAGEVPFVAQALAESTVYGVGDSSLDAAFLARAPSLLGSVDAMLKAPTGSRAKGTGSGYVDASSLAQGWFWAGPLAVSASGAYRFDGALLAHHLTQESVAVAYDLPIHALAGLGINARLFGHQRLGGSEPVHNALHVAFGLEPRIAGIAVGYVFALVPIHEEAERSGLVLQGGVLVPFGDRPPTRPDSVRQQ